MALAVAIGVGQGTNALVGNALGEGKQEKAEKIAGHALSFAWLTAISIGLVIFISAPSLFAAMGAQGPYTVDAMKYLIIILASLGFLAHGMAANGILYSLGDTKSLRNSLIAAFLANLVLDPLFMFTFDWGLYGLALATALTQLGAAVYLTLKVRQSKLGDSLALHNLKPNKTHYNALFWQSLPASANMFLIALGSLVVTTAVARFGENAIAGLGIALRIEQLVLLPTIGLNIAVLSLISVNYGAKHYHRMEQVTVESIKIGISLMVIGGVLIFTFAHPLISLFTDNIAVIEIGVSYLRIEAIILPAYVLSFVAGAVLQGVKRPVIPMYFNIVRQLVLPLTFIIIALSIMDTGIYGIWWSIAIATWLTASVQYIHMRGLVKKTT